MNLRARNTTMVKETDIMFVRHIVQNKRFMSTFNDIPTRKEKKRISILKLSENTKTGFQDLLIDKKGVSY